MNEQSKPVEILAQEHQAVQQKLDALEKAINSLDRRAEIAAELKELAAFFHTPFWLHFEKEEKGFFPEFDSIMPHGAGPLAVMLAEHNILRDTEETFAAAVAAYLSGTDDEQTRQAIKLCGSHFIGTLRSHILKENGLFPTLAEMHLTPARNEKVARLFRELDRNRV